MVNYNVDFDCTYHLFSDYEESDLCYRIQFLDIFNLKNYDNDLVNKVIDELEIKYNNNEFIKKLISKKSKQENQIIAFVGESIGFRMCFQYDKLYVMHYILSKLIQNQELDEEKINNMIDNLKF